MEHPQVARLADDELADVLGRVAPRWLAASRCVCKAWRTLIDDRRLLRADLLPLSLSGIFVHLEGHRLPELFSRPSSSSTGPAISANFLDFLPNNLTPSSTPYANGDTDDYHIIDHCNGLLLLEHYVVNPATRRWAPLPPRPSEHAMAADVSFVEEYLVFDPTVSLHYEVFRIPYASSRRHDAGSEWPPPICLMHCFSSRTGRWEGRSFVRQGEAVGTVADMEMVMYRDYATYWRGALYVHWQADFVMRLQLSNQEYRVIRAPTGMSLARHLGRSEKGVYLASLSRERLRVWVLDEPDGEMMWILKHDNDLKTMLARHTFDCQACGPWVLEDFNSRYFSKIVNDAILHSSPSLPEIKSRNNFEGKFEWNSDDDDDDDYRGGNDDDGLLDKGDTVKQSYYGDIDILGFHPYKEVVFLSITKEHHTLGTGLSYHLGSSKLQVLGNVCPTAYLYFNTSLPNDCWSFEAFPYTPCWIQEFPENN